MANTLFFDKYRPPILPVQLLDVNNTVLHIIPPTVDLQEELRSRMADLNALLAGGADEQRAALYDLAARLMSCNRNMRKVTPEQLQTTYNIDEADLIIFYQAYSDFLRELESAKN